MSRTSVHSVQSLRAVKESEREDESTSFAEDSFSGPVREILTGGDEDTANLESNESLMLMASEGTMTNGLRGSAARTGARSSMASQTSNSTGGPGITSWGILDDSDRMSAASFASGSASAIAEVPSSQALTMAGELKENQASMGDPEQPEVVIS